MDYLLHIAALIGVYAVLAISLDLLVGHTGLLSVAQGAFFGIGAYSAALVSLQAPRLFPLGVLVAIVAAIVLSLVVSAGSLRLRGERFVLLTLAFQILFVKVAMNWISLTGGPSGVFSIPQPSLNGWTVKTPVAFALLAALMVAVGYALMSRIVYSPFGRVLRAIREDETYTAAIGKNPRRYKIEVVMVSASLAALAGAFYAHYLTYIAPNNFDLGVSLLVVAMIIMGGVGTSSGPIIGAATLVLLPEILRFVGVPGPLAANVREVIYGGLLLGLTLLRPNTLIGAIGSSRE